MREWMLLASAISGEMQSNIEINIEIFNFVNLVLLHYLLNSICGQKIMKHKEKFFSWKFLQSQVEAALK